MSCECAPNPCCTPPQLCQPENFGLQFPSLVGPQGPPGGAGTYVESLALLRLLDPTVFPSGYIAYVAGYAVVGDGGGGLFEYDSGSVATDNDGTIIEPTVGAGAWVRLDSLAGIFNVRWFGAPIDGATPALTKVRNALAAAIAMAQSSSAGGGAVSNTCPKLFFPNGLYAISGDISNGNQINAVQIIGDRSIILASAGITVFGNITYMVSFDGITIRGGAIHYSIATGNADTDLLTWTNCESMQFTSRAVAVDNNSNSTQFLFKVCKFQSATVGAKVLVATSGDYIKFKDCWVDIATAADAAFDVTNLNLIFDGLIGVPTNLYAWVELNTAGSLTAVKSRFGGETGGALEAIVINRMAANTGSPVFPTAIKMDDCECYTSGPVIKFFGIPNVVSLTRLTGLANPTPFEIDAAVSAADLATVGNLDSVFHVEWDSQQYNAFISPVGAPVIAREGLPLVSARTLNSSRPLTADLVLQSQGDTGAYTPVQSSGTVTVSSTTDELAVPVFQFLSTADNAFADFSYTTALNGLAAGVYTAVFDIQVLTNHTIRPFFQASNSVHIRTLAKGKHIICLPFYYDGGAAQAIRFAPYVLPNGATLQWQRFRVYTGQRSITSKRAEVEGTAAPTTGQWYRGDVVFNTAKTTGVLPTLWQCLVLGTPGTWDNLTAGSGTYTPTLTAVANVAATVASVAQYIRVGNVVTVSGKMEIDPTAGATLTRVGISLPIASNFAAQENCGGTGVTSSGAGTSAGIYGDAVNDRAELAYISVGTGNEGWNWSFTYLVL